MVNKVPTCRCKMKARNKAKNLLVYYSKTTVAFFYIFLTYWNERT